MFHRTLYIFNIILFNYKDILYYICTLSAVMRQYKIKYLFF